MSDNTKFHKPADEHEFDLAIKRIELAVETLRAESKRRIIMLVTKPEELRKYLDSCHQCRGLCWTWHCSNCRMGGSPPNQLCEHFTLDEVRQLSELTEESIFLNEVGNELMGSKIDVRDIDDPSVPDFVRHGLIHGINKSKRPQG